MGTTDYYIILREHYLILGWSATIGVKMWIAFIKYYFVTSSVNDLVWGVIKNDYRFKIMLFIISKFGS